MKANLHTVDLPTSLENCHFKNGKKSLSKCKKNQLPTNFKLSSLKAVKWFVHTTRTKNKGEFHTLILPNPFPSPRKNNSTTNVLIWASPSYGPYDWLRLEIAKFPTSANFVTSHEVSKYCLVDWMMQFSFCQTEIPRQNWLPLPIQLPKMHCF